MTDSTYNIIISSDKEIPDDIQNVIDDIATLFLQKVVEHGILDTAEDAIKLFDEVYDYAEEKEYDFDIVSQVLRQIIDQTDDRE